jgi:hypothetical protein
MFGQDPEPQAPCIEDSHCSAGWKCVDGNCVETPLPPLPPKPPPPPQATSVSPVMVLGVVLAVSVVGIGLARGLQR